MENISIPIGSQGQNYYGWFRATATRYFGQTFIASSDAVNGVTFKMDLGGALGDVTYCVRLMDVAANRTLYCSSAQTLSPLADDSPGYGHVDELQSVSVSLGNTLVREGHRYALVVELLSGASLVETAIDATNPYPQGSLIYGTDLNQLRSAGARDMVLEIGAGVANAPPTAVPDAVSVAAGAAVAVDALANDTDPDPADTKTLLSVATDGLQGAASIVDGKIVYTTGSAFVALPAGASATEVFSYTMADQAGATSTASVSVTVTGVNDPIVANPDSVSIDAGANTTIDVLLNDTDPDLGDGRHLTALDTGLTAGTAHINKKIDRRDQSLH